jgi:hypothetical protein
LFGDEIGVVADEVGENRCRDLVDEMVERGDSCGPDDVESQESLVERFGGDWLAGCGAWKQPVVGVAMLVVQFR